LQVSVQDLHGKTQVMSLPATSYVNDIIKTIRPRDCPADVFLIADGWKVSGDTRLCDLRGHGRLIACLDLKNKTHAEHASLPKDIQDEPEMNSATSARHSTSLLHGYTHPKGNVVHTPNTLVSPLDVAFPGTQPLLIRDALPGENCFPACLAAEEEELGDMDLLWDKSRTSMALTIRVRDGAGIVHTCPYGGSTTVKELVQALCQGNIGAGW